MGGSTSKKQLQRQKESNGASIKAPPKPMAKNAITSKDRAILDLKNARDRLKKYQVKLEKEKETLHENAKQCLKSGKRDRAKLALQMKRFKEQQMAKADAQLLTVLEMVDTVEWESQKLQIFEGLKAGKTALDAIHKEMTVEAVEKLMEESAEAQQMAEEIGQLIAGNLTEQDEDEVLAELAEIELMEADHLRLHMPEAPFDATVIQDVQLEEKLRVEEKTVDKHVNKKKIAEVLLA